MGNFIHVLNIRFSSYAKIFYHKEIVNIKCFKKSFDAYPVNHKHLDKSWGLRIFFWTLESKSWEPLAYKDFNYTVDISFIYFF